MAAAQSLRGEFMAMPRPLAGNPSTIRNAFIATFLADLPVSYQDQMPLTGDYDSFMQAAQSLRDQFSKDSALAGTPTSGNKPRMPETVNPIDLMQSAIKRQDANRAAARQAGAPFLKTIPLSMPPCRPAA